MRTKSKNIMTILISADISGDEYVSRLSSAYQRKGYQTFCGSNNFFESNIVPDILHVQWPESLYRDPSVSDMDWQEREKRVRERFLWYKTRSCVIVHTVHNLKPHEPIHPEMEAKLYETIIESADILVHHCVKSIELISKEYPAAIGKICIVCPEGSYSFDSSTEDQVKARSNLGIPEDKFVILNFGVQRNDRMQSFTSRAFTSVRLKNKYLIIAGRPHIGAKRNVKAGWIYLKELVKRHMRFRRRKYFLRYFAKQEIPQLFSCADVVFLGHQSALDSGVLPLAASLKKPVVMPDMGCLAEEAKGWVFEMYTPRDEPSAADAILRMHARLQDPNLDLDNSSWLKEHSWDNYVDTVLSTAEGIEVNPRGSIQKET